MSVKQQVSPLTLALDEPLTLPDSPLPNPTTLSHTSSSSSLPSLLPSPRIESLTLVKEWNASVTRRLNAQAISPIDFQTPSVTPSTVDYFSPREILHPDNTLPVPNTVDMTPTLQPSARDPSQFEIPNIPTTPALNHAPERSIPPFPPSSVSGISPPSTPLSESKARPYGLSYQFPRHPLTSPLKTPRPWSQSTPKKDSILSDGHNESNDFNGIISKAKVIRKRFSSSSAPYPFTLSPKPNPGRTSIMSTRTTDSSSLPRRRPSVELLAAAAIAPVDRPSVTRDYTEELINLATLGPHTPSVQSSLKPSPSPSSSPEARKFLRRPSGSTIRSQRNSQAPAAAPSTLLPSPHDILYRIRARTPSSNTSVSGSTAEENAYASASSSSNTLPRHVTHISGPQPLRPRNRIPSPRTVSQCSHRPKVFEKGRLGKRGKGAVDGRGYRLGLVASSASGNVQLQVYSMHRSSLPASMPRLRPDHGEGGPRGANLAQDSINSLSAVSQSDGSSALGGTTTGEDTTANSTRPLLPAPAPMVQIIGPTPPPSTWSVNQSGLSSHNRHRSLPASLPNPATPVSPNSLSRRLVFAQELVGRSLPPSPRKAGKRKERDDSGMSTPTVRLVTQPLSPPRGILKTSSSPSDGYFTDSPSTKRLRMSESGIDWSPSVQGPSSLRHQSSLLSRVDEHGATLAQQHPIRTSLSSSSHTPSAAGPSRTTSTSTPNPSRLSAQYSSRTSSSISQHPLAQSQHADDDGRSGRTRASLSRGGRPLSRTTTASSGIRSISSSPPPASGIPLMTLITTPRPISILAPARGTGMTSEEVYAATGDEEAGYHIRDPTTRMYSPSLRTSIAHIARVTTRGTGEGEGEGSDGLVREDELRWWDRLGVHGWCFFLGFLVVFAWWVGAAWPVRRVVVARKTRVRKESWGTESGREEYDEWDAQSRKWRLWCRYASGLSVVVYVPVIVLAAVFAR